jgi:hypothetical protein
VRAALLLAACLAGGVAAAVPALRPGERPDAGSTEAELWYGAAAIEARLQQAPGLVREHALTAYIRSVLCRVAAGHCDDLRLYVLRDAEFNAAMLPNGATVVFTGALLRLHDEAELAFLLGHEFAHFRQRHGLQQWTRTRRSRAAIGTFSVLTLGAGAGVVGSAAQIAGAAGLSSYSRRHEREADAFGFAQARAGGWAAAAGVALWDRLAAEEAATVGRRHSAVFASHPQTADRQADLAAAAASAGVGGDHGRERYRAAVRPFLRPWLEDELDRRRYAPTLQMVTELHAALPAGERAVTAWALGEAHRRRGAPGDAETAARWFAEAIALPDPPPAAWREHGHARRDAGDIDGARRAWTAYLALAPDAVDRAFVERDLERLGR